MGPYIPHHQRGLQHPAAAQAAAQSAAVQNIQEDATYRTGAHDGSGETVNPYTLYDLNAVPNAPIDVIYFATGKGAGASLTTPGTSKTENDTNFTGNNGQMPTRQKLVVEFIKLFYFCAETCLPASGNTYSMDEQQLGTLFQLLNSVTLEIKIAQKWSMGIWPLVEILGLPLSGIFSPATSGNQAVGFPCPPRFHGIYPLQSPIIIEAQDQFSVVLHYPYAPQAASQQGDWIRVGLTGEFTYGH